MEPIPIPPPDSDSVDTTPPPPPYVQITCLLSTGEEFVLTHRFDQDILARRCFAQLMAGEEFEDIPEMPEGTWRI